MEPRNVLPVRAPSRSPPVPVITLEGRSDRARAQNEYVDTPLKSQHGPVIVKKAAGIRHGGSGNGTLPVAPTSVVLNQPTSLAPLKKEIDDQNSTVDSQGHGESIYCRQCGKCRCRACTSPRELPDTWIGGQHISADHVIEVCSCLCCVKCVFYHLFKDSELDDDVNVADDPCSCCERRHCCSRWSAIGLMSVCLPCLLCYPPLRCMASLITDCYNCCNRQGCRCRRDRKPSGTKRLLLESESSSS